MSPSRPTLGIRASAALLLSPRAFFAIVGLTIFAATAVFVANLDAFRRLDLVIRELILTHGFNCKPLHHRLVMPFTRHFPLRP